MTTIQVEGNELRTLVDYVSARVGNLTSLRVTIDEGNSSLGISVNGYTPGVAIHGRVSGSVTDPVDRLRELADEYRSGNITTNAGDALREVVELLEPAYEQLLRS
jgi:hypothetical protein